MLRARSTNWETRWLQLPCRDAVHDLKVDDDEDDLIARKGPHLDRAMRLQKLAWLLLVLVGLQLQLQGKAAGAEEQPERQLYRSAAKRWKRTLDIAKREAKSGANHFLQDRDQVGVDGMHHMP